ncbi:MAG: uracil-DNA glycosylase [Eubacteriales bacterium]|nr:uracil-DNA glycosylase [Eubacteriales bacterium]
MAVILENDWDVMLAPLFAGEAYQALRVKLANEYRTHKVFPDMYDLFNAFRFTSYEATKVVILGQDPYHNDGQAHGLSFSVPDGVEIPASLANIYRELESDLGIPPADTGNLTRWARQGVLLLNSILTVRAHEAASHRALGWEQFTDSVINMISVKETPVVFILWGAFAQSKRPLVDESRHLVIASSHPSPLSASRGFFGSRPFSRANEFLVSTGQTPIDWRVTETQ